MRIVRDPERMEEVVGGKEVVKGLRCWKKERAERRGRLAISRRGQRCLSQAIPRIRNS